MYDKVKDNTTTAASLVLAGAIASEIDVDRLASGDKHEIVKLIVVAATAILGKFIGRKKPVDPENPFGHQEQCPERSAAGIRCFLPEGHPGAHAAPDNKQVW